MRTDRKIVRARNLLRTAARIFRNQPGRHLKGTYKRGDNYCAVGAIREARSRLKYGPDEYLAALHAAEVMTREVTDGRTISVTYFNDHLAGRKNAVADMLDRAVEKVEA